MIDIHSHIINEVDDGSSNIEMSLNMAKEAERAGITDIICTPHYILEQYEIEKSKMKTYIELLQKEIQKEGVFVTLHQGNEIYVEEGIEKALEEKKASTLGESKYILVEFSINYYPYGIDDFLFQMASIGYIPIIAHPERYTYVQEKPELVYNWIEKGAYIQVNYGSVIKRYGTKAQKTVKKLIKNSMVHFIASDAHRDSSIYIRIPEAKKKLEKWISKEKLELITQINPSKILQGKEIKQK